jgi:tRNA nucleotidyltransferase (CCA-adding enzyme)
MHIILTHEQADFDALASLFGASLADDRGVPVLPRKMNRNARAFVGLYGADLPFGPETCCRLVDRSRRGYQSR